jgi:hypothetical protein
MMNNNFMQYGRIVNLLYNKLGGSKKIIPRHQQENKLSIM